MFENSFKKFKNERRKHMQSRYPSLFFPFFFLTRVFLFILFIRDEHYTGKISTKLLENNEKHFSPDEIVPRIRFPPKVSFLVFLLCRSPLFSQKLSWFHLSRMMMKVYYTYIYTYTDSISNSFLISSLKNWLSLEHIQIEISFLQFTTILTNLINKRSPQTRPLK